MNNAVSGKACEKQRKRTDMQLVGYRAQAETLAFKPHCIDVRVFDEQLLPIELRKVMLLLYKPSDVRVAVLELSNLLMMSCAISPFDLFLVDFYEHI